MWERREHEGERGLLKVSRLVRKDVEGESRTTGRGEGREARFYSYVSAMHSSGVKGIVCCYRNSQLTSSHKSKECTLFVPDSSLAFFSALSDPCCSLCGDRVHSSSVVAQPWPILANIISVSFWARLCAAFCMVLCDQT